jgi:hypothetical protein
MLATGELATGAGYQVYVNGELWREGQLDQGDAGQTLVMTYTAGIALGEALTVGQGITLSVPITTGVVLNTSEDLTSGEAVTVSQAITSGEPITTGVPITVSEAVTVSESITATGAVTVSLPVTTSEGFTTTAGLTSTEVLTREESITVTAAITMSEAVTVSQTVTEGVTIAPGESITASLAVTTSQAVTVSERLAVSVSATTTQAITVGTVISPSLIQPGENQIEIVLLAADGRTAGRLYYAVTLFSARGLGKEMALASRLSERSIGVQREYRLGGGAEAQATLGFQAGEVVEVQLTLDVPEESWYVVVDDPLPAGFEALNERLGTASHVATAYQEPVFHWRDHGYNRKEVRDERVTLFITHLEPGQRTLSYLARATIVGEFVALPTEVYAMYEPQVWSRSDGARVRVAVR